MRLKSFLLAAILFILAGNSYSQSGLPIGSWRSHLPYHWARQVIDAGDRIYCASLTGVFYYDKRDKAIGKITRVEGASGVEVNTMVYCAPLKTLLIAYRNNNIDLFSEANEQIYTLQDINRKPIVGNKVINSGYANGNLVYLSCGFGIVVVDLKKREIKDTYYIGADGSSLNILSTIIANDTLYAATEKGILRTPVSNPFKANYATWTKEKGVREGFYNSLTSLDNKLFVVKATSGTSVNDSMFVRSGSSWKVFANKVGERIYGVTVSTDRLIVCDSKAIAYTSGGQAIDTIDKYAYQCIPREVVADNNGLYWIADDFLGLLSFDKPTKKMGFYTPSGPGSNKVYDLQVGGNRMWVSAGGHDQSWGNLYNGAFVSSYELDYDWKNFNFYTTKGLDTIFDALSIAVDPSDVNHVVVGTWGRGLMAFKNNKFDTVYNESNSTLQRRTATPKDSWIGIGGQMFDRQGNLWVTNYFAHNPLCVRKKTGEWLSYNLNNVMLTKGGVVSTLIEHSMTGFKWIVLGHGGGFLVFDDNHTLDETADDRIKAFTVNMNYLGVATFSDVQCVVEDRDGVLWVGTSYGIGVYYNPGEIFDLTSTDPTQPIVEQDGYAGYLLNSETVNAIAVDGANRKWVATQSSGVYLISPDGTKQIEHFTESNSPLLSNTVTSIVIDPKTGEIFFGTDRGIISYKGTSTKAEEHFSGPYAFPNPVPPGFSGEIGIRGLAADVNVKITDIQGRIVYETTALGGQAIWNGRNLNGEQVSTGVYVVFCTNTDGTLTDVTKILFLR